MDSYMAIASYKQNLLDNFDSIPPEMQQAKDWLISNLDLVRQLTRGKAMQEQKLEKYLKAAYEKEDYFSVALLTYQKVVDQSRKRNLGKKK